MDIFAESFIEIIKGTTSLTPILTQDGIYSGYCSKISTQEEHFYFCFNYEFLLSLSTVMLFDDHPSEEDLVDLSKEIANLVIGHAKVLLAQKGVHIQITTPTSLGQTIPSHSLKGIHFAIQEGKCSMYKEHVC
ncbi:hypothetical protein CQA62_04515 [Helicobacter cholecystus]|uniref:Chemotaxis phosphatase CheX-like domain-containing protein n=1 Tax=Helicobacter cholecystus TaxID=45498 RepID=A0A3D8IUY9_9HELI|nr:chemotaxis protein CheX [Helicobacter cholecystus]RDU69099.1 hypothetical protein CQA62_04515 [Helicobacter cholecystus]VEJ24631.1 Uncharacterised protein [Helicobacter cholecystus]